MDGPKQTSQCSFDLKNSVVVMAGRFLETLEGELSVFRLEEVTKEGPTLIPTRPDCVGNI